MANTDRDLNVIVDQIVFVSLLRDVNFQQGDKSKRLELRESYEEDVHNRIEKIATRTREKLRLKENIPVDLEFAVAKQLFEKLENTTGATFSQITVTSEEVVKALDIVAENTYDFDYTKARDNESEYSDPNRYEEFDLFKELPLEEQNNIADKINQGIFERGCGSGATKKETDAVVYTIGSKKFLLFLQQGKKFDDLNSLDQSWLINYIGTLRDNGQDSLANNYISGFGITEEQLKSEHNVTVSNKGVETKEQTIIADEIETLSSEIMCMFEDFSKLSPGERSKKMTEIVGKLQSSKFGTDAIMFFLGQECPKELLGQPEVAQLLKMTSDVLRDKNSVLDVDGYFAINTIKTIIGLKKQGISGYEELLESFNSRVDPKHCITEEMIDLAINDSNVMNQYNLIELDSTRTLDGEGSLDNFILEINDAIQKGTEITEFNAVQERKKAAAEEKMKRRQETKVSPAYIESFLESTLDDVEQYKLANTQRIAVFIMKNAEEEDKELTAQAILAFLEKHPNEIEKEHNADRDTRRVIFMEIFESGIDNPLVLEKMQNLDQQLLLETAIMIQNHPEKFDENAVKISLGVITTHNAKASKGKVFDASKTDLSSLTADIHMDYDKTADNHQNQEEIEVHEEEISL